MPLSSLFLSLISIAKTVGAAALVQPTTPQMSAASLPAPICVGSSDWLGTRYDREDCQQAVERLVTAEVSVHDQREYEFLAPHASPIHAIPTMRTPRRYTGGACTLVIAMISSFPQGTIPELPSGLYYPADITNYKEIVRAAYNIIDHCVKDDGRPTAQCGGWVKVGGRQSIGVFVWGTFSMMNRRVDPSVNVGGGDVGAGANGTTGEGHFIGDETLGFGGGLNTGLEGKGTAVESS
ncbi:hypothetical protein N7G274_004896 [Stereocaulon virgatum]|uniref:Ecp2 effector protein domain-containing protein n=1 Tax=Stereocaulon virgatum TaxID=373712 RepID=A0ABR4A937_9LECA